MSKTTAVTSDLGRPVYVGEGAVRQQGPRKLYTCNACGGEVVWLESKRTGRFFLASVYRGEVARYYISKPHVCRVREPEPELSDLDKAYQELTERFLAREITRDEYVELSIAIDRAHGVR